MDSKSFLSTLLAAIRDLQAARGSDSIDVAYLGNALRRDGHSWTSHGFERLSAALAQLQADGLVEISRNDKGALRVTARRESAAQVQSDPMPLPSVQSAASEQQRFRPLRPPIWFAFASAVPEGQQRQINRRTGIVWSDSTTPPGSELDWVPVVPVPEDDQRRWAEEFLQRPDISADKDALAQTIRTPDWYRRFPAELEKRGPVFVRAWSHLRSTRIIDHVIAWANKNNVGENVLFAAGRPVGKWRTAANLSVEATTDLRQALLGAIGKMPTTDLLELRIPVRYVIEVVRPDLLQ